jgi:uncharacterized protein
MATDKGGNVITWFEIPAANFSRALDFYEHLFAVSLRREAMNGHEMGVFPYDPSAAISGCVMFGAQYQPGADGAVIYLNAQDKIDAMLARVANIGGRVLLGKTALPPGMGFFAHILDSEGNRVGLHGVK